jgi:hypothetical protein
VPIRGIFLAVGEVSMSKLAIDAKKSNILDMALMFSSTIRLFTKGSKERIARELGDFTSGLVTIISVDDYEQMHRGFCDWFCQEIRTAEKTLKNGKTKQSQYASFGQAAKVLDVALKVYVYYCSQPSLEVAVRIDPFLHGAVDTAMMKYLKLMHPETRVRAVTIEQVDEQTYRVLQALIARDIKDNFQSDILPVQWDDIMWQKLNRGTEIQA